MTEASLNAPTFIPDGRSSASMRYRPVVVTGPVAVRRAIPPVAAILRPDPDPPAHSPAAVSSSDTATTRPVIPTTVPSASRHGSYSSSKAKVRPSCIRTVLARAGSPVAITPSLIAASRRASGGGRKSASVRPTSGSGVPGIGGPKHPDVPERPVLLEEPGRAGAGRDAEPELGRLQLLLGPLPVRDVEDGPDRLDRFAVGRGGPDGRRDNARLPAGAGDRELERDRPARCRRLADHLAEVPPGRGQRGELGERGGLVPHGQAVDAVPLVRDRDPVVPEVPAPAAEVADPLRLGQPLPALPQARARAPSPS